MGTLPDPAPVTSAVSINCCSPGTVRHRAVSTRTLRGAGGRPGLQRRARVREGTEEQLYISAVVDTEQEEAAERGRRRGGGQEEEGGQGYEVSHYGTADATAASQCCH